VRVKSLYLLKLKEKIQKQPRVVRDRRKRHAFALHPVTSMHIANMQCRILSRIISVNSNRWNTQPIGLRRLSARFACRRAASPSCALIPNPDCTGHFRLPPSAARLASTFSVLDGGPYPPAACPVSRHPLRFGLGEVIAGKCTRIGANIGQPLAKWVIVGKAVVTVLAMVAQKSATIGEVVNLRDMWVAEMTLGA
jgi:hypothetical protein